MHRQEKAHVGSWLWVVLGLCALAALAAAFRASRNAVRPLEEAPQVIAGNSSETPDPGDTEEVSLPLTLPVLPEEPEPPQPAAEGQPEAPSVTPAAPAVIVVPLEGEAVAAFSADALQYNDTLADWRTHEGLDIAAAEGAEVCAACAGTVASVTENDLLGTTVVLDHAGGRKTVYASLSADPPVKAGDSVRAGQVIGAVGNSALSETALGPHLHFAVLQDEEPVDPLAFLEG